MAQITVAAVCIFPYLQVTDYISGSASCASAYLINPDDADNRDWSRTLLPIEHPQKLTTVSLFTVD